MNKDICIIDDNFLKKERVEELKEIIMHKTPFFFLDKGGAAQDGIHGISGDKFIDYPILINSNMEDFGPESLFYNAKDVVSTFLKSNGLKLKSISRSRSNLSYPSIDRRHTPPHVDDADDHYTFIYYVNDSDGDTNLYEQHFDGATVRTQDDLTLFKGITPKAGRGVLFKGTRFHTWQPPFETKARCIINMNILIEDNNV